MTPVRATALLAESSGAPPGPVHALLVVVQGLMAVATVIGYGLLVGDPDPTTALYLATGVPTITLITVGLVMTPQMVATARTDGSLDWLRTLPSRGPSSRWTWRCGR
jgi:ABC-2 type transport system permease protein